MKTLINFLILLSCININAQEYKGRDEKHPIQLSEKNAIYEQYKTINKNIIWKFFLKKKGGEIKLLDEIEIKRNKIKVDSLISKNKALILNQEIEMNLPKLVDAYKEGKQIYVFLYKNRSAMLQIYDFEDGINFKKYEYSLIHINEGSVAKFGGYFMKFSIKRNEKKFFRVTVRRSKGRSKSKSFRIKNNNVYELKFFKKVKLKNLFQE